jgi:hemolysin activation/secretion protein
VRGFIEREFSNDIGYIFNIEIYTPDWASEMHLKDGSFRWLGFIDSASGWNKWLPGEIANRTSVGSMGVGFRYTQGKNFTAKFDLAKVACTDTDGATCTGSGIVSRTGNTRGHIGLVLNW